MSVDDNSPRPSEKASVGAPAAPKGRRPRPLWNNFLTLAGLLITVVSILMLLTFGLFRLASPSPNPYVDIVGYLVLPFLVILGLGLSAVGIWVKRWWLKRRSPANGNFQRFPRIDLNDPKQRRTLQWMAGGLFVILPVVAVSSYHAYHFTDSPQFCSKPCHSVMHPQAATYEHSAHARVACAECHIGSGASWFVKSKLSGLRQVIAMFQKSYPRPIPPAITNLRPARETCEECHWPRKFFGAQLKEFAHFAADETNTERTLKLLLKTGGGDEEWGRAEGIHMHMALSGRIEYVATDDKLQVIPWVRWVDPAGTERIFRDDGAPSSDPPPPGTRRTLDCMDCHNRPAHKFRPPQEAVDLMLKVGRIDRTLPWIKREAVRVLSMQYTNTDTALARIGQEVRTFYETQLPEVWRTRRASIFQAIDSIREIYTHNFAPDMRVDWRTYPDNIGHLYSPGCFRCHDGKHVDATLRPIQHECSICHTFLKEGEAGELTHTTGFQHPLPFDGQHRDLLCNRCHTGGPSPQPTCAGCHEDEGRLLAGTLLRDDGIDFDANPMAELECQDCHDTRQRLARDTVRENCNACHDDPGYGEILDMWLTEFADLRAQLDQRLQEVREKLAAEKRPEVREAVERWMERAEAVLDRLVAAGPMHNPDGVGTALSALLEESEDLFASSSLAQRTRMATESATR